MKKFLKSLFPTLPPVPPDLMSNPGARPTKADKVMAKALQGKSTKR